MIGKNEKTTKKNVHSGRLTKNTSRYFERNKIIKFQFVIAALSFLFVIPTGTFASMQKEIDHLLNYIETSDCVFIRNGSRHTPEKGAQHIRRKYNYLKKRIKTTDDFIKGAATKSSISGKPYTVVCNEKEMTTADWLRIELRNYRHSLLQKDSP